MARLSPQATMAFLVLLAVVAWGIVVAELLLRGMVSTFALANAAIFTAALALWPLLTGARLSAEGMRVAEPCRECGALALPVPGIPFCLHCGAYPKSARSARSARA